MHRRVSFRSVSLFLTVGCAVAAFSSGAAAGPGDKDKDAQKLLTAAMDDDYLNVALDKAEKKLKDALKKCGKDGCSAGMLGKLHVALATVYSAGNKGDLMKEELVAALKADSGATLISGISTPELEKAYAEAKKSAGAGGAGGSSGSGGSKPDPTGGGGDEGGSEPGKQPKGDLQHTPPAEQAVNTPVPIYIEVPDEVGAEKATLKYKPFGGNKWKTVEMQKVGKGYGAEIPCEDVTTTGDIKYFIITKDASGDPAATAGSMKDPYKVAIKNEIEGDPPKLPGKKAPDACAPKEDCPPGLPGCPDAKGQKHGDKGWGASCEESSECTEGLACVNGSCEEGKDDGGGKKDSGKGKKNIASLGGQFDLLLIGSAEKVCDGKDPSYVCFYPSDQGGGQFYGKPAVKSGTNGIQGGFGLADVRALVGFDRVLLEKAGPGALMAGLRVGFAFGGSPSSDTPPNSKQSKLHDQAKSFLPLHAELRGTYVIGGSPVEQGKIRPYVFVGGGLAQVNAAVKVNVCDELDKSGVDITASTKENPSSTCPSKTPSKLRKDLDAYQITGLNFIGVGGGATYAFTPNIGVGLELKVMIMLPTTGIVFAPTVGPVFGF